MEERRSVSSYVLKMKGYIDQIQRLESSIRQDLVVNLILNSLTKAYDHFVMNYNMQGWNKSIFELHQMLKMAEEALPGKALVVLYVQGGGVKKPKYKGRGRGKNKSVVPKTPFQYKKKKKESPVKDATYYHCGKLGYWKRNCPDYLAEIKRNKVDGSANSGSGKV